MRGNDSRANHVWHSAAVPLQTAVARECRMLKVLGWVIGIIFLIGLLVVIGVVMLGKGVGGL